VEVVLVLLEMCFFVLLVLVDIGALAARDGASR
jgi:hypothetical protein